MLQDLDYILYVEKTQEVNEIENQIVDEKKNQAVNEEMIINE